MTVPSDTSGERMPKPKNDRLVSAITAAAMPSVASMISSDEMFGRMCRITIFGPGTPMYFAAVTYSRSRTDIVRLRTIAGRQHPAQRPQPEDQPERQVACSMLRMNTAMIKNAGQHEQEVDDPQRDALEPAAEVGRERPDDGGDRRRADADEEADEHRHAQSLQAHRQHVATGLRGPEPVAPASAPGGTPSDPVRCSSTR